MIRLGLDDYRPAPTEQRAITLSDFPQLATILSASSGSGVVVTEETAKRNAAFFDGIDVLSNDVAKIPRRHFRELEDGSREKIGGSPVDRTLRYPSDTATDFDTWKTVIVHALTWGNGYLEIEWDRALRPVGLHNIAPHRIRPNVVNNRVAYKYDERRDIAAEDIIHIKGLGADGIQGYSLIALARLSIGLGLNAEQFGSLLFSNGGFPGVMLEHPGKVSKDGRERLIAAWDAMTKGTRANSTVVLEEGMKANKLTIPPNDAQFLETREFQVLEVARWLNLPPHKLKHQYAERPGGSLADSELDYLAGSLDPWLVRIEQECSRKLIPKNMRGLQYVEHERKAFLRMSATAQAEVYKAYLDMGVMTAEQIAAKENLPKPPKKEPAPEPVAAPQAAPAAAAEPDESMRASVRALLMDAFARYGRREAERVRRLAKKGAEGLAGLDDLYADEVTTLRSYLAPAVRVSLSLRKLDVDADVVTAAIASDYVERSKEALQDLPAKNTSDQAEALLLRWESSRPLEMAERSMSYVPEMRQQRPVVNVSVAAPVVHVAAPTVNTSNTVNVPEQAPAQIRFDAPTVTVNVPEQPTPNVTNTVNVLPPDVRVENVVQTPSVTVNVPASSSSGMEIERDAAGNITGVRPRL